MNNLLYQDETYAIRGAIYEVYREMGCGFLEQVYQECLELEFISRNIPHVSQPEIALKYKMTPLKRTYKCDFICHETIIVEIKAIKEVTDKDRAQLMNYLKAADFRLGLLVNFGCYPKAMVERIIL